MGHVQLRLYIGNFARKGKDEETIRNWCATQRVGAGAIDVYDLGKVVEQVRSVATAKTYIQ